MPTYSVELPDGSEFHVESPTELNDAQVWNAVNANLPKEHPFKDYRQPEGAVMSALRSFASGIPSAIGTGVAGALGATGGGAVGGPGGAAAGGIAAGAAGGALGEEFLKEMIGEDAYQENLRQMEANRKAHEIASSLGSMTAALPSMMGGGGPFKGLAKEGAGLLETGARALPETLATGARMAAGGEAAKVVGGEEGISDALKNTLQGAITMGPVAFVPAARTILGSTLAKAPADAAVLGLSNALYDRYVNQNPDALNNVWQKVGTDVPGFMLLNAIQGYAHGMPFRAGKEPTQMATPEGIQSGLTSAPEVGEGIDFDKLQQLKGQSPKDRVGLAGQLRQEEIISKQGDPKLRAAKKGIGVVDQAQIDQLKSTSNAEALKSAEELRRSDEEFFARFLKAKETVAQSVTPDTVAAAQAASEAIDRSTVEAATQSERDANEIIVRHGEQQESADQKEAQAVLKAQEEEIKRKEKEDAKQDASPAPPDGVRTEPEVPKKAEEPAASKSGEGVPEGGQKEIDNTKPVVASAVYRDPVSGKVYYGRNHPEALAKAKADGVDVDPSKYKSRKSRETDDFGFLVRHPDGTTSLELGRQGRIKSRLLAKESGQEPEGKGPLHSDQFNMDYREGESHIEPEPEPRPIRELPADQIIERLTKRRVTKDPAGDALRELKAIGLGKEKLAEVADALGVKANERDVAAALAETVPAPERGETERTAFDDSEKIIKLREDVIQDKLDVDRPKQEAMTDEEIEAEQETQREIEERRQERGFNTELDRDLSDGGFISTHVFKEASDLISSIGRDVAKWAGAMVKKFGEAIKPYLQRIWNHIKDAAYEPVMRGLEKIGAVKFAADAHGGLEKSSDATQSNIVTPAGGPFKFRLGDLIKGDTYAGAALAKDGSLPTQTFIAKTNKSVPRQELELWRSLAPEAFSGDRVNVKELADKLSSQPAVEVHVYGQSGKVSEARAELDKMTHEWVDNMPAQARAMLDVYAGGREPDLFIEDLKQNNIDLDKAKRYRELRQETKYEDYAAGPRATQYYNQISLFDTKKSPVKRVDVVLPTSSTLKMEQRGNGMWTVFDSSTNQEIRSQLTQREAQAIVDKSDKRSSLWVQDNLHENLPNTVGWAMIQEVPDPKTGERTWVIAELQGRWPQRFAEEKRGGRRGEITHEELVVPGESGEVPDHPLLSSWENLVLKSVIDEAQKAGVTKLVLSDGETAMMTEGHDQNLKKWYRFKNEDLPEDVRRRWLNTGPYAAKEDGNFTLVNENLAGTNLSVDPKKAELITEPIPQEGGMRAQYDKRGPDILKKLTGDRGQPWDGGVHKNALKDAAVEPVSSVPVITNEALGIDENTLPRQKVRDLQNIDNVEYNNGRWYFYGDIEQASRPLAWMIAGAELSKNGGVPDATAQRLRADEIRAKILASAETNSNVKGSPVFRNPDGTPKTNVTGRIYDLMGFAKDVTKKDAPTFNLYSDPFLIKTAADALYKTARDVKSLFDFTTQAVKRFGEWVTPHLRSIWNAAKSGAEAVGQYLKDAFKASEVGAAGKFSPGEIKKAVAEKAAEVKEAIKPQLTPTKNVEPAHEFHAKKQSQEKRASDFKEKSDEILKNDTNNKAARIFAEAQKFARDDKKTVPEWIKGEFEKLKNANPKKAEAFKAAYDKAAKGMDSKEQADFVKETTRELLYKEGKSLQDIGRLPLIEDEDGNVKGSVLQDRSLGYIPRHIKARSKFKTGQFKEREYRTVADMLIGGDNLETWNFGDAVGRYMRRAEDIRSRPQFLADAINHKDKDGNYSAIIVDQRPLASEPGSLAPLTTVTSDRLKQDEETWVDDKTKYKQLEHYTVRQVPIAVRMDDGTISKRMATVALSPELAKIYKQEVGHSAIKEAVESPSQTIGTAAVKAGVRGLDKLSAIQKASMFFGSAFHGGTVATRLASYGVNPLFKTGTVDLNPDTNPNVKRALKDGLMLWREKGEHDYQEYLDLPGLGGNSPANRFLKKIAGGWLFEKYIPEAMMKVYDAMLPRTMKDLGYERSGKNKDGTDAYRYTGKGEPKMTEDDIRAHVAKMTNEAVGHLNFRLMGRDKTLRHLASWALLSPQFTESTVKSIVSGVKGTPALLGAEAGKQYRQQALALWGTAATAYLASRIINGLINDGDMKMDAKDAFNIVVGDRAYSMRMLPHDALSMIMDPSHWAQGREGPLAKLSMEELNQRNYRGEKITHAQALANFGAGYIPMSIQNFLPELHNLVAHDRKNPVMPIESVMNLLGINASDHSPIRSTYERASKWKEANGEPNEGSYPTSHLTPLKRNLENADPEGAAQEFEKLVTEEAQKNPGKRISEIKGRVMASLKSSMDHPFAGTKDKEKKFFNSLNENERKEYIYARQKLARMYDLAKIVTGAGSGEIKTSL